MGLKAVDDNEDNQIQKITEAISYAENNGATICCLALSTEVDNVSLYNAIAESQMLFVVAAGSEGFELGTQILAFPAMYQLDNVITVADIRCDGMISIMSNYGDQYVDVFAPGTDILCISGSEGFEYVSGTSIATSLVAGICSIIRSGWDKELNPSEIRQILIESSKKEDEFENGKSKGGIVSLYNCLASTKNVKEQQ